MEGKKNWKILVWVAMVLCMAMPNRVEASEEPEPIAEPAALIVPRLRFRLQGIIDSMLRTSLLVLFRLLAVRSAFNIIIFYL